MMARSLAPTALLLGCSFAFAACSGDDLPPSLQKGLEMTDSSAAHGQLDAITLYEIGLRYMREGQLDAALEHFDRALALEPANARLHDARSSALFTLGEYSKALAASERAVKLLEGDSGLHVNRGLIYVQFGRKQEALEDYARALELSPNYAPAFYNRGVLHFNQADNEAALADFGAAIQAQPELANPYFNRAMVYETLGNLQAAIADMTSFLQRSSSEDHQDLAHTLLERWGGEFNSSAAQRAFRELVTRCKMEFTVPVGFTFAPGQAAKGLDYEAVLLAEDGALEIRFALRSLADVEIDYQDPHSAKPAPEHIYPLLYTAIVQEISTDPHSASGGFGENALGEFNADWGQMSLLRPKTNFSNGFESMLFVALHRRAAADAYMVFLFDDYETVQEQIKTAMQSLYFAQP